MIFHVFSLNHSTNCGTKIFSSRFERLRTDSGVGSELPNPSKMKDDNPGAGSHRSSSTMTSGQPGRVGQVGQRGQAGQADNATSATDSPGRRQQGHPPTPSSASRLTDSATLPTKISRRKKTVEGQPSGSASRPTERKEAISPQKQQSVSAIRTSAPKDYWYLAIERLQEDKGMKKHLTEMKEKAEQEGGKKVCMELSELVTQWRKQRSSPGYEKLTSFAKWLISFKDCATLTIGFPPVSLGVPLAGLFVLIQV